MSFKEKQYSLTLIIGLVELVPKDERVGCKKISVGVYIERYTWERVVFFLLLKKKLFGLNKCIWKKKWRIKEGCE